MIDFHGAVGGCEVGCMRLKDINVVCDLGWKFHDLNFHSLLTMQQLSVISIIIFRDGALGFQSPTVKAFRRCLATPGAMSVVSSTEQTHTFLSIFPRFHLSFSYSPLVAATTK